jgi:hypothetical protein
MKMKAATAILNRAVQHAQENVVQARNNVQALKGKRRLLGRILNALTKALNDQKHHVFVTSYGDVHVTIDDLPSFKCMELEMVLNALENMGTIVRTKDYAECLNRDFIYKVDGVDVYVATYVKSGSETCKRVAVSTEIQEIVKYEIQCS